MKGIASWSRFSWGLNPTKSIQIPLGSVRGWPGCISGPGPWAQVNAVCQDFYRARPVDNPPAIGFIGLFPLSRVWGIDAPGELDDGIYDLGRPESVVERARWGERLKGTDFIRHIFLAGRVLGDILWSEPLIFVAGLPQASRGVHSLRRPAPQAKAYFNYPRAPLYSQKAHQPFCPEFSRPPPPPPLPSPPLPYLGILDRGLFTPGLASEDQQTLAPSMGADGASSEAGESVVGAGGGGGPVTVHVRCSNGSKFSVQVALDSTVGSFKVIVAEKSDVPAEQQRLIYKGRILKDEQTLESYGIVSFQPFNEARSGEIFNVGQLLWVNYTVPASWSCFIFDLSFLIEFFHDDTAVFSDGILITDD